MRQDCANADQFTCVADLRSDGVSDVALLSSFELAEVCNVSVTVRRQLTTVPKTSVRRALTLDKDEVD